MRTLYVVKMDYFVYSKKADRLNLNSFWNALMSTAVLAQKDKLSCTIIREKGYIKKFILRFNTPHDGSGDSLISFALLCLAKSDNRCLEEIVQLLDIQFLEELVKKPDTKMREFAEYILPYKKGKAI